MKTYSNDPRWISAKYAYGLNATHAVKIDSLLRRTGLCPHEVKAYGSQITVEFFGRDSADRAAILLSHAFRIRNVIESMIDAKENKGTCLRPTKRRVFRVYACVKPDNTGAIAP